MPCFSTPRWTFTPWIFLPPSKPRSKQLGADLQERLSNLISGNLDLGASVILVEHVDVDAVGSCPVLVDFDEDGGDKSKQSCFVGKDANLAGATLDLLLDGALDRIGCAQAATVLVWKAEHGEPLGHGAFQPVCELGCGGLIGLHEPVQLFLGAHQGGGIPDAAEFGADGFADGGIGRVVDGVLSQMKLAALPLG